MTTTYHQSLALEIREIVQEMLVDFLLVTNRADDPDYDEASAISAYDAMLTKYGSLGELLDYLTEVAV